jgi:hypothetical protein
MRANSYNSLDIGYRPKIPASIRLRDIIDPKHVRKSFSRRHGQVSPDVTHVAVKELIAKRGHATIVSTHRGRGQDNRDILMLGGNRSEGIVERPDALFKIRVEGPFRLAARPHQYGRIFCQRTGDGIFGPLGHIANNDDLTAVGMQLIDEIVESLFQ